MEQETIDRLTVAGLLIFFMLGILYLCWDNISRIRLDVSLDPPAANLSLPAFNIMDLLNFDWFYKLDPASKIVLVFVVMLLVSTLVGSFLLYMKYRRQNAQR